MSQELIQTLLIAIVGWLVTWGSWVTMRIFDAHRYHLTREEHAEICMRADSHIENRINEVKEDLGRRIEEGRSARERQFDELHHQLERQDENAAESRRQIGESLMTIIAKIGALEAMSRNAADAAAQAARLAEESVRSRR